MLQALAVEPHHCCVSIASAGDNTLAMVAQGPRKVVAVDLNLAQIACLELRVAAYRCLTHPQLLQLLGSRPTSAQERRSLYGACRGRLSPQAQRFWDQHPQAIAIGFGAVGRFEQYLQRFRRWVLPLIHPSVLVAQLLMPRSLTERQQFYDQVWNSWRWRALFQLFFSRILQGRLGRDPSFLRYVDQPVATILLKRVAEALTLGEPATNPYLQWILIGSHPTVLPYALRAENFEKIRAHLGCLEWQHCSLESFLAQTPKQQFDRYNLSNIFEYMSEPAYEQLLHQICDRCSVGARLAYWNLFVHRQRPEHLAHKLRSLTQLQSQLNQQNNTFFYQTIVVEQRQ